MYYIHCFFPVVNRTEACMDYKPHSFKNNHKELNMYVKKLPWTCLLKVKFMEMFPKPTVEKSFSEDKRIKTTL